MATFSPARPAAAGGRTVVAPGSRPPMPGRAARPAGPPNPLRDSFQQLYALKPTRTVFAEEAVKLLIKGTGAKGIGLLSYDERKDRTLLLASGGLPPDAVHVLAGADGRGAWDIPLRALRNRRINVIESAQTNPFVPGALVALSPRQLTIAVLPFYHAGNPVGAVVLFSPTARGFPDIVLQNASQALRICAAGLAELPEVAGEVAPAEAPREQTTLLKGVATLKTELARLSRALQEAERRHAGEAAERITAESFLHAEREKVQRLQDELSRARAEVERLAPLESRVRDLDSQAREVQASFGEASAEIARLQAALAEARRLAEEAQESARQEAATVEGLSSLRDELQQNLEQALSQVRENAEQAARLSAEVAELGPRAARLEELQEVLKATESDRDRLAAERRELESALAASRSEHEAALQRLESANAAVAETQQRAADLASHLEDARQRAAELEDVRRQLEDVSQARATLQRELEELRHSREKEVGEAETTLRTWAERFTGVERERDGLLAELERVRGEAGSTATQLHERLEAAAQERTALVERIEALTQTEGEKTRLHGQLEKVAAEMATQRQHNEALEARIRDLDETNARLIAERRDLHERIEDLSRGGQTLEQEKQAQIQAANAAQARVTELESALSRMAHNLNALRSEAAAETAKLREDLAAQNEQRARLEDELQRSRRDLEDRSQKGDELAGERARLLAELDGLRREQAELTELIDVASRETAELTQQRDAAATTIATLEKQVAEIVAARDGLERDLRQTTEKLVQEAAEQMERAEAAQRELEQSLAAERGQRTEETQVLQSEMADLRAAMTAQIEEMSARHQAAEVERQREIEGLQEQLAEKAHLLQAVEERLSEAELLGAAEVEGLPLDLDLDLESDGDLDLEIHRSAEHERPAGEMASDLPEPTAPPPPREILLLDAGEGVPGLLETLRSSGLMVKSIDPAEAAANGAGSVACAAVNVALPGAWESLRRMRRPGRDPEADTSLLAYALAPGSKNGFWFGPVEFSILPVESGLVSIVQHLVPKLRRVIAMSTDLDVMSAVRAELSGARISTAVVLDGRQTVDLLPTVRPEAAVLHLSPICSDVFRAIAGLRSSEIARDIPILFLLDEEPQPREDSFLNAGIRMLSGRGNFRAEELTSVLAGGLAPFQPAAA